MRAVLILVRVGTASLRVNLCLTFRIATSSVQSFRAVAADRHIQIISCFHEDAGKPTSCDAEIDGIEFSEVSWRHEAMAAAAPNFFYCILF